MNTGYWQLLVLGGVWTAIAIVVSEGRRRDCPIPQFYFAGSLVAVLILAALAGAEGLRGIFAPEARPAVCCFFVGSLLNGAGQAISMKNLSRGGRAFAYAIPQQAFLFPYLWSIAFWGQYVSPVSVAGIGLIVAAMFYLSVTRSGDRSAALPRRRILIALLAMSLLGVSQIVLITPTRSASAGTLSQLSAACVILGANALFFLIWSSIRPRGFGAFRLYLPFGAAWGVCAATSYCILLSALGILGKVGQSGIVFPVGAGILICLYSLFTVLRYREKLNWRRKCAFAALVCGIALVKLG
jgi:drug/metabolite transporter (DMT)-like permease